MNYPHLVEYFDSTSEVAWLRPGTDYTFRESAAADAPYVREFTLREFTSTGSGGQSTSVGEHVSVPETDNQTIFVDMDDPASKWRGVVPAGTRLSNHEGSESTLTRCEVAVDFIVTADSIRAGLDYGGGSISPGPHQPLITRNWAFAIPRESVVRWHILTPMEVTPLNADVRPGQLTWVRFSDIGTSLGGSFSSEAGQTVLTSQRVRTFSIDSVVSRTWHEGDYVKSEGQYYVILGRRVSDSGREIEFDAEANPKFRLVAPLEEQA